jgi:hypothetical protein
VVDVSRFPLDGHDPVAVRGNEPARNVAIWPIRIVSFGVEREQPACANPSAGTISIRMTALQKDARLRGIICCTTLVGVALVRGHDESVLKIACDAVLDSTLTLA